MAKKWPKNLNKKFIFNNNKICSQIKSLIQPNTGDKLSCSQTHIVKFQQNVKWVGPPPSLIIIHPEQKKHSKNSITGTEKAEINSSFT